jgi:hypothetical protein
MKRSREEAMIIWRPVAKYGDFSFGSWQLFNRALKNPPGQNHLPNLFDCLKSFTLFLTFPCLYKVRKEDESVGIFGAWHGA